MLFGADQRGGVMGCGEEKLRKIIDPELVEVFLENTDTFRQIKKLYPGHAG